MTGWGKGDDRLHQSRARREGALEKRLPAIGIRAMRGHLLEVVAGGEQLSRCADDDHAHRFVVARGIELCLDRLHDREREKIGRRILELQPKHWPEPFGADQ